jgi:hypothetical protein
MPKVVTEFKGDASGLSKSISSAKMQLGTFAKSAASVGAGMAGFSGVEAIIGKVGASIGKVANLSDAAANVGLTVEEYQKLGFAFRDVGLSAADADKAMATMNAKMGEAIGGSEGANEALNKLGLTAEGLKDLSAADQFEAITKAISKLPTQAERAAAATDFFGKSGKKLDQLVMGYDAVMKKAEEAGNMIGGDTADAADRLGDELAKLDDAFTALVANSGLIEFLSSAVKGMVDLQQSVKGGVSALLEMEGKLKDIGGTDKSSGAYSGSLWENMKDAWLGESEGEKITTKPVTKAEQKQFKEQQAEKTKLAKEAADKEAAMQEDAKKKLGAKEHAKDKEKTDKLVESADKVLAASDERARAMTEASNDKLAQEDEARQKILDDMEKEIDLQKLLNEGKNKEAAIKTAQDKMREAGGTDAQVEYAGKMAEAQFGLSQDVKPQFRTEYTDSLLRMGGTIGNTGNVSSDPKIGLQREANTKLDKLYTAINEQTKAWKDAQDE